MLKGVMIAFFALGTHTAALTPAEVVGIWAKTGGKAQAVIDGAEVLSEASEKRVNRKLQSAFPKTPAFIVLARFPFAKIKDEKQRAKLMDFAKKVQTSLLKKQESTRNAVLIVINVDNMNWCILAPHGQGFFSTNESINALPIPEKILEVGIGEMIKALARQMRHRGVLAPVSRLDSSFAKEKIGSVLRGNSSSVRKTIASFSRRNSSFGKETIAKVSEKLPSRKSELTKRTLISLIAAGLVVLAAIAVPVLYCLGAFKSLFN